MDGNPESMASWWGTQRCCFVLSRVRRAASAPHLAVVQQRWLEQLELLSCQAQALQQQCLTQRRLMAQAQTPPAAEKQREPNGRQPLNSLLPAQSQESQMMLTPQPSPEILPAAEGEELLRAVFSVADTPNPDEIKALAQQAGRSQGQVRSYFTKMRSSVQAFLQRAVAKERQQYKAAMDAASRADATEGSEPHSLEQHSSKLASQLAHVSSLLDRKGAINMQAFGASAFVPLMKSTLSYEVREAQLRALNATPAKVSYKLVTGPLLSVLEAWLLEGDADQQHKFVREVLGTIQRLPMSWPLLQGSSLLHTAARFAAARNARTAAAAQDLLRYWGQRFDDLAMASVVQKAGAGKGTTFLQAHMPSVPRKRAGSHRSGHSRSRPGSTTAPPADLASAKSALVAAAAGPGAEEGPQTGPPAEQEGGAPEVDKGASMAVPLGRQQPRKHFTQPKPAHFSTRPMSVDDIRKQKQKEANKASLLAPHKRLTAASQADPARPPVAPGNGPLGRSSVGGHVGVTGPHNFRGHMNGGRVGAAGRGTARAGTTGSGVVGLPGKAGSLIGQQQQQQQQGRPQLAGVVQPPPAKRRAVGGGEGVGAPMPSAPPGMVLMEELQQRRDGDGGGAGDDDDEELPPEAVAALKEYHELKRQRQALEKAAAVTADPALQKEIAQAIIDYNTQEQQLEAKAERKREQEEFQRSTALLSDPSQIACTFAVHVPWYNPVLLPQDQLAQVAIGEDSHEWAVQEERASRLPPVRYGPSRPPPATPAEPAELGPPRGPLPPAVPWLPLNPMEQEMQNRRLWDGGLRVPTYAVPYPGARAGMRPPPPSYQSLPPSVSQQTAPAAQPEDGTPHVAHAATLGESNTSSLPTYPAAAAAAAAAAPIPANSQPYPSPLATPASILSAASGAPQQPLLTPSTNVLTPAAAGGAVPVAFSGGVNAAVSGGFSGGVSTMPLTGSGGVPANVSAGLSDGVSALPASGGLSGVVSTVPVSGSGGVNAGISGGLSCGVSTLPVSGGLSGGVSAVPVASSGGVGANNGGVSGVGGLPGSGGYWQHAAAAAGVQPGTGGLQGVGVEVAAGAYPYQPQLQAQQPQQQPQPQQPQLQQLQQQQGQYQAHGLEATATQPLVPAPLNASTLHTASPYGAHAQPVSSAIPPPFSAYAGFPSQPQGAVSSQPLAYSGYAQAAPHVAYQPPNGAAAAVSSHAQPSHPAYQHPLPTALSSQPPPSYAAYQSHPQQQPYTYTMPGYPTATPQAYAASQPSASHAPTTSMPAYTQPAGLDSQAQGYTQIPQAPTNHVNALGEQQKQAQALAMLASNPSQAQSLLSGLATALRNQGGSEHHTAQLAQLQQMLQQQQQPQPQTQPPPWR